MGKLPVALVIAITLLVIPGRAPAAPNFYADSWAVIIGINDYDVDRIPPLRYAVNDARSMDFPPERMIVLLNQQATKAGIERVLGDQLRHQMSSNERLLVFFAGHGKTDRLRAKVLAWSARSSASSRPRTRRPGDCARPLAGRG